MTLRVLIAFDKFKGSLDAETACAIAARTIERHRPDWQLDIAPLTDGGDGLSRILTVAAGGHFENVEAAGPLFDGQNARERVSAAFGWVRWRDVPEDARELLAFEAPPPERVAVIDLASVNGLALVPSNARDVWRSSSFGTGELIAAAVERSSDALLLGVGGSATSDLGLGALQALGMEFEDADGHAVHPLPLHWSRIARVSGRARPLPPLRIACDVKNPLFGPQGAAAIYGPQKGLSPADLPRFEAAAQHMANTLCSALGTDPSLATLPGAGAAGGIAFGLTAAAGARLVPGFELVSRWCQLRTRIEAADLVITGEGRFDASSWAGKGPGELVRSARELGRRSVVFAGEVASDGHRTGARLIAISRFEPALESALRKAAQNLEHAIERWLSHDAPVKLPAPP